LRSGSEADDREEGEIPIYRRQLGEKLANGVFSLASTERNGRLRAAYMPPVSYNELKTNGIKSVIVTYAMSGVIGQ